MSMSIARRPQVLGWIAITVAAPAQAPVPAPTARAYLEEALDVIERSSMQRDTDWTRLRQNAFATAGAAQTPADTWPAIREALSALGDRHSFLLVPEEAKNIASGRAGKMTGLLVLHPEAIVADVLPGSPAALAGVATGDRILGVAGVALGELPRREFQRLLSRGQFPGGAVAALEVELARGDQAPHTVRIEPGDFAANRPPMGQRLDGDLGYLEVPALGGGPAAEKYADNLQALIEMIDIDPVRGWIVDLRRNTGGNMWPMLAGVGPLLGNGKVGAFASAAGSTDWTYRDGKAAVGGNVVVTVKEPYSPSAPVPVAVLTSGLTASSGEAIVVAFRGRDGARTFGEATRGVPTANQSVSLSDGALLVITVSVDADRNGRTYDDRIEPDEQVANDWAALHTAKDPVLAAARKWLSAQSDGKR